jgi:hypothetical protein
MSIFGGWALHRSNSLRMFAAIADVIQLERKGETYTLYAARFGEPFVKQRVAEVRLTTAEGVDDGPEYTPDGGQATINVPSWSPDSRTIAFVSNTDFD